METLCDCKQAPLLKNPEFKEVPSQLLSCVCDKLNRYVDFASRQLTNDELQKFFLSTVDMWWENMNRNPIAPDTTLDGVIGVLEKNLDIANFLFKLKLIEPEHVSRIDKVEFIERVHSMAHDTDASILTRPCFKEHNIEFDPSKDFLLRELAAETFNCLAEGKWLNLQEDK